MRALRHAEQSGAEHSAGGEEEIHQASAAQRLSESSTGREQELGWLLSDQLERTPPFLDPLSIRPGESLLMPGGGTGNESHRSLMLSLSLCRCFAGVVPAKRSPKLVVSTLSTPFFSVCACVCVRMCVCCRISPGA